MKVKHKKSRKHRKPNPVKAHKATHRRRRRHNPAPSTHKRRRHRRRNPSSSLKGMAIDVGVIVGALFGSGYLNNFAAKWLTVKYRGAASLGLGAALALFVKNDKAKAAGMTAIGAGLFDLLRQNVPALVPFSAEDAGWLLGSAAASDRDLAQGLANSGVPGVLPNVFGVDTSSVPLGYDNSDVPGVLPNVFGVDTSGIPLGEDDEGESLFGNSGWN